MDKKYQNERESVRRNLIFYLTVRDKKSGVSIGELGDITEGGLLIMSEKLIPITERMSVAVELPKGTDYADTELDLNIEVQWAKKDPDNSDIALAGCKILHPSEKDREMIRKLVEKIGFSNGQRRIIFSESFPDFTENAD